ncbi:MAG: S58 family peptidase [Anaerolineae bacterium]|nr:MAG: S58 family peptidase [Anaerolineae bacterium]
MTPRPRLRDLGITPGHHPPGPLNAITDVPGLTVGHATVLRDAPATARTGITVILPRGRDSWANRCFAASHTFNGNGEMTGLHYLHETGIFGGPFAITNTYELGMVRDALIRYMFDRGLPNAGGNDLPVVAETWDGWLSDLSVPHLTPADVYAALDSAAPGRVPEGSVGGGTGMICHEFKGGIGTASRLVTTKSGTYTLGALVQANQGGRAELRLDGFPIGRHIPTSEVPTVWGEEFASSSSIIVVLATDAPLLPVQCRRLAQRATVGVAQVGSYGHDASGEIFFAFSTATPIPATAAAAASLAGSSPPANSQSKGVGSLTPLLMLPNEHINPLLDAAAEATAEAIWNCLLAAETMTGLEGHTVYGIPIERVKELSRRS